MNRQDLIDAIAEDTEASKAATTRFLDSLITIVQSEVAKGGAVKLTGFVRNLYSVDHPNASDLTRQSHRT